MLPVLFEVGQFKFYSFGTFIALGAIAGGYFMFRAAKQRRLKTHHFFDTVLYTLLFALVGARISYYFIYSNQFQSFWQVFYFWQGGLVALGGLIIGFLAFLYQIKRERDPLWKVLDIGALGLLLAWAVGKFGCFMSSCSIGRSSDSLLAINGALPVDLYSSIWAFGLFLLLRQIWQVGRLTDGVVFFLSLETLFLGELLIKTLRADFGEGVARIEAMIYLGLIVVIYLLFWKMHGPKIQRRNFTATLKNFVFRRKR